MGAETHKLPSCRKVDCSEAWLTNQCLQMLWPTLICTVYIWTDCVLICNCKQCGCFPLWSGSALLEEHQVTDSIVLSWPCPPIWKYHEVKVNPKTNRKSKNALKYVEITTWFYKPSLVIVVISRSMRPRRVQSSSCRPTPTQSIHFESSHDFHKTSSPRLCQEFWGFFGGRKSCSFTTVMRILVDTEAKAMHCSKPQIRPGTNSVRSVSL